MKIPYKYLELIPVGLALLFMLWVLILVILTPTEPVPCAALEDVKWADLPARCVDYYIKK